MNFITLFVTNDESLYCNGCRRLLSNEDAYLVDYKENTITTAFVKCKECLDRKVLRCLDRVLGEEK